MSVLDEMKNLQTELKLIIKVLETKNTELNDTLTKKTEFLNNFINNLSNENVLLQAIPKKMEDKLKSYIPQISAELSSLNEANLRKLEEGYLKIAKQHTESLIASELKLKTLTETLLSINARRIKRFFLGVWLTVFISISVSVAASYFMMHSFPVKVVISHPDKIILNESQVSLWGTENVKILKETK